MFRRFFVSNKEYKPFIVMVALLFLSGLLQRGNAQQPFPPPLQLQVYTVQYLGFGSFYTGASGGTVQISPTGLRSTSGTVIGLTSGPGMQAIFNVRLVPGRLVHISMSNSAILTRVGGYETMTVTGFVSDKPGNSFVTTGGHPFINPVQIGATLYVGNLSSNPAGDYTGTFSVTFIQE